MVDNKHIAISTRKTRFVGLRKRGVPFENAFWGREVHGRWFPSHTPHSFHISSLIQQTHLINIFVISNIHLQIIKFRYTYIIYKTKKYILYDINCIFEKNINMRRRYMSSNKCKWGGGIKIIFG